MPYGYNGRILHVDLSTGRTWTEERDEIFFRTYVGGGLLGTKLLLDHVTQGADPLGPDNVLIFASSVVAGTPAPGMARFSTIAKSPMTGGVGETRTEGPFGPSLKRSGFDAIAIHGAASRPVAVEVAAGSATIRDAQDLWGSTVGAATDRLTEKRVGHVAAIGPAGERLVRFASIVTDRSYQASRMGMGAVMGSKKLKALVLRDTESVPAPAAGAAERFDGSPRSGSPVLADEEAVGRIAERFAAGIEENDLTAWQYEKPGFSCWIYLHGLDAALSVNNYTAAAMDGIESYAESEFLKREIDELGCPDCPVRCIKAIHPAGGSPDPRADGIHQEITGAMGVNLGITDLDAVFTANHWCNQYGLDPTSLGYTISCAIELRTEGIIDDAAIPAFEDAEGVLRLVHRIAGRDGIGDRLAEGSARFAESVDGAAYAMHAKRLELVPFEPRSQTNLALGYAVAPIGPRYDICEHDWDFDTQVGWDHTLKYSRTLGILERVPMGYIGVDKVRNFKALLTLWSAADALDMCIFAIAPTRLLSLPAMSNLVAAITGWDTSSYELMKIGERRLHLMRCFNLREGLGPDLDTLPDRFFAEPLTESKREGDVLDRQAFSSAVVSFYRMMGWDDGGVPTEETLADARLPSRGELLGPSA